LADQHDRSQPVSGKPGILFACRANAKRSETPKPFDPIGRYVVITMGCGDTVYV
jgi:hypothetical protein